MTLFEQEIAEIRESAEKKQAQIRKDALDRYVETTKQARQEYEKTLAMIGETKLQLRIFRDASKDGQVFIARKTTVEGRECVILESEN